MNALPYAGGTGAYRYMHAAALKSPDPPYRGRMRVRRRVPVVDYPGILCH